MRRLPTMPLKKIQPTLGLPIRLVAIQLQATRCATSARLRCSRSQGRSGNESNAAQRLRDAS